MTNRIVIIVIGEIVIKNKSEKSHLLKDKEAYIVETS